MDKGAECYWNERLEHGAISGIQSAYNLIFRHGLQAFMSEYQNEPSEKLGETDLATTTDVLSKRNHIARNTVKAEMQYITAGVDVHKHIIYYLVAAFKDGGSCQILDYGCHPKQRTGSFQMHSLSVRLGDLYKGTEPARITQGLRDLIGTLEKQIYSTINDENKMHIEKIFIDSGYKPACVQKVKTEFKTLVVPSRGKGIKASSKPMESYQRKPGERHGHHLYYPLVMRTKTSGIAA